MEARVRPLTISIVGLILMVPAIYFFMTLLIRILFGYTRAYYHIAPTLLDDPFDFLSLNKGAWIVYGPLLAILLNSPADIQLQLSRKIYRSRFFIQNNRHWLNTAIALQAGLLFILLIIYLAIEHYRY